ncbi:NAD(P)-dependent dehydrogenase (short-subunit alcohol dehydrogenase family) [Kitasatospora sp. MAP12-15]|uniref:oxidoreductase n=1 Tax=unclassified Kitasatospora TaxID=2633591 RepID=UPI002475CF6E|nr:oxidoreductase [Kitasatospora sp. MAP12-44]MDH6113977.1 NAD(P)-dependent dehydrogenase (short-subunit alcohol dehydrogenase family) [Kitasatospora sp. MAP12-44]
MTDTQNADHARRWLITGANSGFGIAFARAALAAGDIVIAGVRRPESMAALIAEFPGRITALRLDVTDAEQCAQAVKSTVEEHGRIDVLVNNAGFGIVGALEETTEDELRNTMEVMFFGALRLTRLVLPHMRARRSGTIVQVTSMGGMLAFPGVSAYCAAKGALELASEALAGEVAPLGIKVLIVEPGAFRTEFAGPALKSAHMIEDYEPTVGAVRAGLSGSHGQQPGDPAKAAAALLAALDLPELPLRLALGEDAVTAIRGKLAAVGADLDATAALSLSTAIDA